MNPTLVLEMVERDGRVVYLDPHQNEVYVVSAEAYQRFLRWAKTEAPCAHVWVKQRVGQTHLPRLTCSRCGAVSYGYSGEDDETTT